jgi:transcriptional regulator with XRE-family HTH domain
MGSNATSFKGCVNMDIEKFVSKRIVQLRLGLEGNVSASTMSLDLGQNRSYINRIENCRNVPSLAGLSCICDYFNITAAEFFDDSDFLPEIMRETIALIKQLDENDVATLNSIARRFLHVKT